MLNNITIAGNLTKDPVLKDPADPTKQRVEFRIMADGLTPMGCDAVGISVVLFGKAAPYVAERAKKGTGVVVSGRLEAETQRDDRTKARFASLDIGGEQPLNVPVFRIVAQQLGGVAIQNLGPRDASAAPADAAPAAKAEEEVPF